MFCTLFQRKIKKLFGNCKRGISLIEMLTITVIVSVLAIILVPVAGIDDMSKRENELRTVLRDIRSGLSRYSRDNHGYPNILGIALDYKHVIGTSYYAINLKKILEIALLVPHHVPIDREDYGINYASKDAQLKDIKNPDQSIYIYQTNWSGGNILSFQLRAFSDALDATPAPPYVPKAADQPLPFRTMIYFHLVDNTIAPAVTVAKYQCYNRTDGLFYISDMKKYYWNVSYSEDKESAFQANYSWVVYRAPVRPPYLRGDGRVLRHDGKVNGFPANPITTVPHDANLASDQWEVLINFNLPLPGSGDYKILQNHYHYPEPEAFFKSKKEQESLWFPIHTLVYSFDQDIHNWIIFREFLTGITGPIMTQHRPLFEVCFKYMDIVDIRYPCNFPGQVGLTGTGRSKTSTVNWVNGSIWNIATGPFRVPKSNVKEAMTIGKDSYLWEL